LAFALTACGERRDTAELAGGVNPFNELRGVNIASLRAGQVRAMRAGAEPAPYEGLREPIGAYDVMFEVAGFVGADSTWPIDEASVVGIEATREWPNDSAARAAFDLAVLEIRNATGATPHCVNVTGPGFSLRVTEFDRGGGWTLAVKLAPEARLTNRQRLSARHSIAVRQSSVLTRFPEAGTPNPDERPVWTRVDCAAGN